MKKRMSKQQPEVINWFGEELPAEELAATTPTAKNPNPCIAVYGPGPEGRTCGYCSLLVATGARVTYWKCSKRTITSGPKTDHRKSWDACSMFREASK